MTERYKNRYRIASARATWWSYDWAGAYFITICTKNRYHFFGHVTKGEMYLSSIGELANQFWFEIPDHAHNVELGAFQVMPNHVHGVLILRGWLGDGGSVVPSETNSDSNPESGCGSFDPQSVGGDGGRNVGGDCDDCRARRDKACLVSTGATGTGNGTGKTENETQNVEPAIPETTEIPNPTTKQSPLTISQARFRNQGKNTVSSIIGGYESAVSRHAHRAGHAFSWQSRFYDHIIRNDEEYQRINDYVETNPQRWRDDRFFPFG
jgi:REP element-mobilizing transposase RayT